MRKNKISRAILALVKITGLLPAALFFKPKKYLSGDKAKRFLPKPSILMSNHTSLMDFPFYVATFPLCTLRFWMAEVLFKKSKLFSWFLFKIGGVYINRDVCDFSFVSESLEILDNKGRIGVFPQGRLPVDGKPFPFKSGIVPVALRTDAPIIPVYTDGNYGIFKRAHVIIGEPIYLREFCNNVNPTQEEIEKLTAMLEEKNYQLKAELERKLLKHEEK